MSDVAPCVLAFNVPGGEPALLRYIIGAAGRFPSIEMHGFDVWRRAYVEEGHLRRYVERVRALYRTGDDPGVTYLACPLCPLEACGTGLDTPVTIAASREHAREHLVAYAKLARTAAPILPLRATA